MSKYLMKCGHVSNSTTFDGKPACAICIGTNPNALIIDHEVKNDEGLEGRFAICIDSKNGSEKSIRPSKWTLPFFEYRPNEKYDYYYDGSWGWD